MDKSPLSKLPAELRNRIWELALASDVPLAAKWRNTESKFRPERPPASDPAALTKTCKQLRAESGQLFYTVNHFILRVDKRGYNQYASSFQGFIKGIEAAGAAAGAESVVGAGAVTLDLGRLSSNRLLPLKAAVKVLGLLVLETPPAVPVSVEARIECQRDACEAYDSLFVVELNMRDFEASYGRVMQEIERRIECAGAFDDVSEMEKIEEGLRDIEGLESVSRIGE